MSIFKTDDLPNVSIDQSGKIKALPATPHGKTKPIRRKRGGKRR